MRTLCGSLSPILAICLTLPAVCFAGPPRGRPSAPNTPAGAQFTALLKAYNSGDPAIMRRFVAYSYDRALGDSAGTNRRTQTLYRYYVTRARSLQPVSFASTSQTSLTALLRSPLTEEWTRMQVATTHRARHLITGVSILPMAAPPTEHKRRKANAQEVAREVGRLVGRLAKADAFSGAALVGYHGKTLYKGAAGLANEAFHARNTPATRFNLGSLNKMFTGVAILQQVQRGRLSLSDRLGKLLPDFPNAQARQQITLRHLLNHTSGLGDFYTPQFAASAKDRYRTIRDYFPLFARSPLRFRPGSRFEYNNADYLALGAILERATGQSYESYVRANIYDPAGMKDTAAFEQDKDASGLATGYTRIGGPALPSGRRNNLYLHIVRGGPSGGGYSTVEDLNRFADALLRFKLLSPEYTNLALTGGVSTPLDGGARYGLGFMEQFVRGTRIAGHTGGFPGMSDQIDIYPELGVTVIALSNYDPPAAQLITQRARDLLAGYTR